MKCIGMLVYLSSLSAPTDRKSWRPSFPASTCLSHVTECAASLIYRISRTDKKKFWRVAEKVSKSTNIRISCTRSKSHLKTEFIRRINLRVSTRLFNPYFILKHSPTRVSSAKHGVRRMSSTQVAPRRIENFVSCEKWRFAKFKPKRKKNQCARCKEKRKVTQKMITTLVYL